MMIDDEMWNTSGFEVLFILFCCLHSQLSSQTLVPQVSHKIRPHPFIRIAAVCVVESSTEDLEIEYSIVLLCLYNYGKTEVCHVWHFVSLRAWPINTLSFAFATWNEAPFHVPSGAMHGVFECCDAMRNDFVERITIQKVWLWTSGLPDDSELVKLMGSRLRVLKRWLDLIRGWMARLSACTWEIFWPV